MRISGLMLAALIALSVLSTSIAGQAPVGERGRGGVGIATYMTLTTPAFKDSGLIPAKYTQDGDQTSPALTWTGAPASTMSYVLYFHDIDVVRDKTVFSDQLHWLVWNIPSTTTALPEGVPMGATLKDAAARSAPTVTSTAALAIRQRTCCTTIRSRSSRSTRSSTSRRRRMRSRPATTS